MRNKNENHNVKNWAREPEPDFNKHLIKQVDTVLTNTPKPPKTIIAYLKMEGEIKRHLLKFLISETESFTLPLYKVLRVLETQYVNGLITGSLEKNGKTSFIIESFQGHSFIIPEEKASIVLERQAEILRLVKTLKFKGVIS